MEKNSFSKLKKILMFLDEDTVMFGVKCKKQKLLILVISLILACILITNNVLNIRKINMVYKPETVKLQGTDDEQFITIYDVLNNNSINKVIQDDVSLYENDLKYTPFDDPEIKKHERTLNSIAGTMDNIIEKASKNENHDEDTKQLQDDMMNYSLNIENIKKMNKVKELRLKPTVNVDFKNNILKAAKNTSEHSKTVIKGESDNYLILKVPKVNKDLTDLVTEITKSSYIVYNKTHAIGTVQFDNKDNKTNMNVMLLNPFDFRLIKKSYIFDNINDIIKAIPNGYPNTITLYKDGTIEITNIVNNIAKLDPYDVNSLAISSIRLVSIKDSQLTEIQNMIRKFEVK